MVNGRNSEEQRIIEEARAHEQGHLFSFWDELNDAEKDDLIEDIGKLDFEILEKLKPLLGKGAWSCRTVRKPDIITIPQGSEEILREKEARDAGYALIASSKTAVFTAAGGQSSRLGIDAPKGTYPVSPVKKKSLFQLHAEKIAYLQNKFNVKIPWLVMVSETNKEQTADFFESHNYFGLDGKFVRFIEQGMFPALDRDGRIFLSEKHRVFLSPTGHGGTFSALHDSAALPWLRELGIEEIFYFQVDNALVKILDPVFIGYHSLKGCDMSSKCVAKAAPDEKVGVFAAENDKTTVVEYTELGSINVEGGYDTQELKAGNIAIHLISLRFAERCAPGGLQLPFHVAHKAIPHIDENGKRVVPESPNGYKVETFVFDALSSAENTITMEVERREEFSPLKSKTGNNSPETVLRDQVLLFAEWFDRAGISVPRNEEGMPRYRIEVSPLFAAFREDFVRKIYKKIKVDGDICVEEDTYRIGK